MTVKKNILVAFVLCAALTGAVFARAMAPDVTVVPEAEKVTVKYTLKDTTREFSDYVLTLLKGGAYIKMRHVVRLFDTDGYNNKLDRQKDIHYVKYNVLTGLYEVENADVKITLDNESQLLRSILSAKVTMQPAEALVTGDEYVLKFRLETHVVKEGDAGLGFLGRMLSVDELKQEVVYIAR